MKALKTIAALLLVGCNPPAPPQEPINQAAKKVAAAFAIELYPDATVSGIACGEPGWAFPTCSVLLKRRDGSEVHLLLNCSREECREHPNPRLAPERKE